MCAAAKSRSTVRSKTKSNASRFSGRFRPSKESLASSTESKSKCDRRRFNVGFTRPQRPRQPGTCITLLVQEESIKLRKIKTPSPNDSARWKRNVKRKRKDSVETNAEPPGLSSHPTQQMSSIPTIHPRHKLQANQILRSLNKNEETRSRMHLCRVNAV